VGTVPFKLLADKANDASTSDSQTQLLAAIQVLLEAIDPKSLEKAADQAEQFDQMKAQILKIKAVAEKRAEVQESESQEIKVFFRSESFFDAQNRLTPGALRTLSDLAKSTLILDPYPKISIATYVSETQVPSAAAAIEQTTEQAMAVFRALAQEKISPQLMSIAGYGQDKPLLQEVDAYGNKVQQAAKRNSRVEITIKRRRDYR
jgi:outer membrane protein OmpA-like peptidoglycan-associated protein